MDKNPPQPNNVSVSLPQPILDEASQTIPESQISQGSVQTPAPAPQQQTPPVAIAQDGDGIEPEWVARVNQLIQQNINDPRLLSQEFEKLKSQYIAGRYGKEMKHSDGKG